MFPNRKPADKPQPAHRLEMKTFVKLHLSCGCVPDPIPASGHGTPVKGTVLYCFHHMLSVTVRDVEYVR